MKTSDKANRRQATSRWEDVAADVYRQTTRRYVVALGGIAIGMLLAYVFLLFQIKTAEDDAKNLNVSGRQRMLSQRIALKIAQLTSDKRENQRNKLVDDVSAMISLMRSSQRWLSNEQTVDRALQTRTDSRLDQYLREAEATIAKVSSSDAAVGGRIDSSAASVLQIAGGDKLLDLLDTIVSRYQQQAEQNVTSFKRLETVLLATGLLVLILEVFFIFRPITQMTRGSLQRLATSNAELSEFAYRISHDIRAPVVSSLGLVDEIEQSIQDGDYDELDTTAGHMKRSLKRVVKTVGDITELMRLRQDIGVVREVAVVDMVQASLDKVRRRPQFDAVDWQIDGKDLIRVAVVDEILIRILSQLFDNAIQYRDSSRDSFVRVDLSQGIGRTTISVQDNGLGIPKEFEHRLFQMFERFHPGLNQSSGLGLYIASQNAILIGGELCYHRREPGSSFELTFPNKRD